MQDQEKDLLNNFIEHAEDYLKTRQEYSKLLAVEKGSKALSAGITTLILFCIFLCFFIFISLAIAYLISEYTGKISTGFGIVGAFLVCVGVYAGLFVTPPDAFQGESVRILYIHVPAAMLSTIGWSGIAISS